MNYNTLKPLIDAGHSTRMIADGLKTSQTNIRYWLAAFSLRTARARNKGAFYCKCGEQDPTKYYGNKRAICAKCDNAYTVKRQQERMQRLRELLGNRCFTCHFDRFKIALSFHHIDPKKKDPSFRSIRGWKWSRALKEVKKCKLLCNNCHAAVHAGLIPCEHGAALKMGPVAGLAPAITRLQNGGTAICA